MTCPRPDASRKANGDTDAAKGAIISLSGTEMTDPEPTNGFEALVSALREKLGPSSGITDEDVDPDELQSLMTAYASKESEWNKYAFRAPGKSYTRNLVDKGNGKCNLVRRVSRC